MPEEAEEDCPKCGRANRATARYCAGCGETLREDPRPKRTFPQPSPLQARCRACEADVPQGQRFGFATRPAAAPDQPSTVPSWAASIAPIGNLRRLEFEIGETASAASLAADFRNRLDAEADLPWVDHPAIAQLSHLLKVIHREDESVLSISSVMVFGVYPRPCPTCSEADPMGARGLLAALPTLRSELARIKEIVRRLVDAMEDRREAGRYRDYFEERYRN